MSNVNLKQKNKTLIDCIKEDKQALDEIQKMMDILIGHRLSQELECYYRGYKFRIKCYG